MSEKSFHHDSSDPGCNKVIVQCETEQRSLITLLLMLGWVIIPAIIIISIYVLPRDCLLCDIEYVERKIEDCADLGPLANDRRQSEGLAVPHPDGTCKNVKEIIWDSIDYKKIAAAACEECGDGGGGGGAPALNVDWPLVFGGEQGGFDPVVIEIEDAFDVDAAGNVTFENTKGCMTAVIGIEVQAEDNGVQPGDAKDTVLFREEDLDLPPFCNVKPTNPSKTVWSLLDRPRVQYTRTVRRPQNLQPAANGDDENLDQWEHVSAPYAVFIAQQKNNPDHISVFVLFVDFVTKKPAVVEIAIESLIRRKSVISQSGSVQLISNFKLNSLDKTITFQVGYGAEEIAVAGYDFGPESTNAGIARRNRDSSGSYVVCLDDNASVTNVYRRDLGGVCPA